MTKDEADELVKKAEPLIGSQKPVVTDEPLGLPSIIELCRFDEIFLIEDQGEFIPMAKMLSIKPGSLIKNEILKETPEYLQRISE